MRQIDQVQRRKDILENAAILASDMGLMNIRREHISERMGIADGLIAKPFGSMHKLRVALVVYAVENKILPIVAEGLSSRDESIKKAAQKAKDSLKRAVIESLI